MELFAPMDKTLAFLMCLILSIPIIFIIIISLTYQYDADNENKFEKYLQSDSCIIMNIIEEGEYYIYVQGHNVKAKHKDKIEYRCTDGNSYIR